MALDSVKNFAIAVVSQGYDSSATSIVLETGKGALFPAPSTDGAFNIVWWRSDLYPDPAKDPDVEIVRCTARTSDTLTITRAQEGTSASAKNASGGTYSVMLAITAKMITDIQSEFLSKTNTAEYTPSTDYHPATKKYVDENGGGSEGIKVMNFSHPFTVYGEIKTPSGDTDFIPPVFVSIPAGQTIKLVGCKYVINSGTSVTAKLQKNGSDITGFTGISVTSTAGATTGTATFADGDKIALVVTAVSGTPKNMSFTLYFEYSYTNKVRIGHTYPVVGEVKVPSGDTDFIVPYFVSIPTGKTANLVGCKYIINSGTSATVKLQKNGSDITGFTSISVGTTAATTFPSAVSLADGDKLALVVTGVSTTPKNMSFSIFIEYSDSGSGGVTKTLIQNNSLIYAEDAGSNDTYAITLDPAPSAYTTGMVIHFKANTVNTGACTLNVNSLGAKTIKKNYDVDLADGDIKAGQSVCVIYDGTNFQILGQLNAVSNENSVGSQLYLHANFK